MLNVFYILFLRLVKVQTNGYFNIPKLYDIYNDADAVLVKWQTCAVGEVVVSVGALVTVEPVVVGFTRTLTSADLTHLTLSTVHMALARHTARVAVVTHVTSTHTHTHTHSQQTSNDTDSFSKPTSRFGPIIGCHGNAPSAINKPMGNKAFPYVYQLWKFGEDQCSRF